METRLRIPALATLMFLLLCAFAKPCCGQLVINQSQSPNYLVHNYLIGDGVAAGDTIRFNGNPGNLVAPLLTSLGEIGRFNGSNTVLGLSEGIFLCTGNAATVLPGPNNKLMSTIGPVWQGAFIPSPDLDLSLLTGWANWNQNGGDNIGTKAVLEFDLVPNSDMLSMRFVFSSEEYERWACGKYNDPFGFFLSGPGISGPYLNNAMNIALVPGTLDPVAINSVNSGELIVNANGFWASQDPWEECRNNYPSWLNNVQYYRYNGGQWPYPQPSGGVQQLEAPYNADPYYIQHNGLTVVFTANAAVQCGETYHLKIAIGNASDNQYASAVWIEKNSLTSGNRFSLTVDDGPNVVPGDTVYLNPSNTDSIHLRFNRRGGFYLDEWLQLAIGGNAVNGIDILPTLPDSIHFNQLDSSVVYTMLAPVSDGLSRLLKIDLVTCGGSVVVEHPFMISMDHTLGIQPARPVSHEIQIIPNPASNHAVAMLPGSLGSHVDLFLTDLTGRCIWHLADVPTGPFTLDVGTLPVGVYTLKTVSPTGIGVARVGVWR